MTNPLAPIAITAAEAPTRVRPSLYPAPFAQRMEGRSKQPLGDLFGLKNFGLNLTRLAPGALSSLRHAHSKQDEFIYILSGQALLISNAGETLMTAGMCAGFAAGNGDAHHLHNRSNSEVIYLEIGDRSIGDQVVYPDDDLQALMQENGQWLFLQKDGQSY